MKHQQTMDLPHVLETAQGMCFKTTDFRTQNQTYYTSLQMEICHSMVKRNIGSHLSLKT